MGYDDINSTDYADLDSTSNYDPHDAYVGSYNKKKRGPQNRSGCFSRWLTSLTAIIVGMLGACGVIAAAAIGVSRASQGSNPLCSIHVQIVRGILNCDGSVILNITPTVVTGLDETLTAISRTQTAIARPTDTPVPSSTATPTPNRSLEETLTAVVQTQTAIARPTDTPLPSSTATPTPDRSLGETLTAVAQTQTAIARPTNTPVPSSTAPPTPDRSLEKTTEALFWTQTAVARPTDVPVVSLPQIVVLSATPDSGQSAPSRSGGNSVPACINTVINHRNVDLSNYDFSGQSLCGADFTNADLEYVNFENSNMTGASFANGDLNNVSFRGANLTNVNFRNADLVNTDLTNAITTGADFTNADVQ